MVCNTCYSDLPREEFHKSSSMCKECKIRWRLASPTNFALTRYAMMKTRSKLTAYKVLGCTKAEFITWSLKSNLPALLDDYKANNLWLALRPEIDRRDWTKGYTLDNIQWLTHNDHIAKVEFNKGQIPVDLYTITGKLIHECNSLTEAANFIEDSPSNIHKALQRSIVAVKGLIPCYKNAVPSMDDLRRCNDTKKSRYWIDKQRLK